jgi:RNA polymerase sigma-70 factor (sigma-E family)
MDGVVATEGARKTVRDDADTVFAAMFREHFRELVRLATLLGADDADDVVQEAFARLHQHGSRLREPDRALAYIRTTVVNLCHSRLRRLAVARRPHPYLVITESALPESAAVQRADQAEVLAALQELPARQREVVVLRYWLELPGAEIATAMGISVGSVKSHTARAMASLGRLLKETP